MDTDLVMPTESRRGMLDRLCDWLLVAGAPSTLAGGGPQSLRELEESLDRLDELARGLAATTTKETRWATRESSAKT